MPKKGDNMKKRIKYINAYFRRKTGHAQEAYYEILDADYQKALERAEVLCNISKANYKESTPIMITVPEVFLENEKVKYRLDQNPDGTTRLLYDQSQVTTLFFGEEMLYYHRCNIYHPTGQISYDIAGEFRYLDVVHVETAFEYDNLDKPKYLMLNLYLSLVDGTEVELRLRNDYIDYQNDKEILTTQEEQVLTKIKEAVRKLKA